MKAISIAGLIVVVLLLIAVTWINLSRKRRRLGWMSIDETDLAIPCAHPVTIIVPVFDELTSGETRVAIIARCKTCNASMLDRLRVVPESDGRLHIENATDATIAIEADGELHHLWPAAARHPAQATLRPPSLDWLIGTSRHDAAVQGFGRLDDLDNELHGDRPFDEGDKS